MNRGFLRKNAALLTACLKIVDLLAIFIAAVIAYYFRAGTLFLPSNFLLIVLFTILLANWGFQFAGIYRPWRGHHLLDEITRILLVWGSVAGIITIIMYFTKTGQVFSRLWFGIWIVLALILLVLGRILLRKFLNWLRSEGYNKRYIVILGAGDAGKRVLDKIHENPWAGLEVVGFFDDQFDNNGSEIKGIPILGSLDDVIEGCKKIPKLDQVWISLPISEASKIQDISMQLIDTMYEVHYVPDIFSFMLLNHSSDEIAGIPVINLKSSPIYGIDGVAKVLEDYVVSVLALIITAPIMLLVALAIKLDSPGPVFFKQKRWGLDGKEIMVWKFRSMKVMENNPEKIVQAAKDDERVTKIGKFLRKTSLDELPQFFNVLQGRMSVVGPRPHAVAHNKEYMDKVNQYVLRHFVKPGITGLAQVNGFRGETESLEKMQARINFDVQYITEWSIWLDMKIILLTIIYGFTGKNAY